MKLSVKQIIASVAGAVIAALALSFLGVGGTIIGVALGSAAATITSAVAFHSLEAGHKKVKEIVGEPTITVSSTAAAAPPPAPLAAPVLSPSDWSREGPAIAVVAAAAPPPPPSRRGVRWPVVGVIALVFVLALGTVTVIELAVGRPLSSVVNGGPVPANKTSVGGVFSGGRSAPTSTTSSTTSTTHVVTTTTGRPPSTTTSQPTTTTSTTTSLPPTTTSTVP